MTSSDIALIISCLPKLFAHMRDVYFALIGRGDPEDLKFNTVTTPMQTASVHYI